MTKSARKRKIKSADFSKAKLKLGKGKQIPSNVVDTSYKCRSIALPNQSTFGYKDKTQPVTKRGLTFDDLIARTKHPNSTVRRDAILGLRELLDTHSDILDRSLPSLINSSVRLIGDEDPSTRKTLLHFFTWLCPRVRIEEMLPHLKTILLFTTHAQSHLFPETRMDAVHFLDVFLEHYPDTVVSGWDEDNQGNGARVLGGYLGILGVGPLSGGEHCSRCPSSTYTTFSPLSKLIILRSLSTFLRFCVPPLGSSMSRLSHSEFPGCAGLKDPLPIVSHKISEETWKEEVDLEDSIGPIQPSIGYSITPQWLPKDFSEITTALQSLGNDIQDTSYLRLIRLANRLHPILLATFLDCAPEVFSPSATPSEHQLQSISSVFRILRSLYTPMSQCCDAPLQEMQIAFNGLSDILRRVAPYFPFDLDFCSYRNNNLQQASQDLNLIVCELVSFHLKASSNPESNVYSKHKSVLFSRSHWTIPISNIADVILRVFVKGHLNSNQLQKPLNQADYISVSSTIWAILNSPTSNQEDLTLLLNAAIDHSIKTSCRSTIKLTTISSIARLVHLHSQPPSNNLVRITEDTKLKEKLEEWVAHLPRALCDFDADDLRASEYILRLLLYILQRRKKLSFCLQIKALKAVIVPYFLFYDASCNRIPGPFSRIPTTSTVRRHALDVAIIMSLCDGDDDKALIDAVEFAVVGTDLYQYWCNLRNYESIRLVSLAS